jgi:hypothetical protein
MRDPIIEHLRKDYDKPDKHTYIELGNLADTLAGKLLRASARGDEKYREIVYALALEASKIDNELMRISKEMVQE